MPRLFRNNASSLTASLINAADGQVTVSSGQGSLFPSPTGGDIAICTLEDVSGNLEIVHLTARTGDILTITRGQEGTVARTFPSGSRIEMRPTRALMEAFLQKDGDSITGPITMTGAGVLSGGRYQNGELVNTPIRGATGVTSNEFLVPAGGGAPTIGGQPVYHAGNLLRATVAGILYPTGVIVMWFGASNAIPTGWVLCDGANGTPDLRGRFIVGAGGAYSLGATGGSGTTTSAGGHTHTIQGTVLDASHIPSHSHTLLCADNFSNSNADGWLATANMGIPGEDVGPFNYRSANQAGTPLVGASGGGGASHTHTADAVGGHTHDVLPPYFGLFFIMKT